MEDEKTQGPSSNDLLALFFAAFEEKIDYYIQEWDKYYQMEKQPMIGGNIVKEASYGGTAAGLKMARGLFEELRDKYGLKS